MINYTIIVTEDAREELLQAYLYYEQQQAGLGERFLSEVENRFDDLEKHPEYYSVIDEQNVLRDVAVNNFPYVLIYRIAEKEVRIYAVFNTAKKPTRK